MPDQRPVITGLGVITPLGVGIDQTWAGLIEARSVVQTIDLFAPGQFPCKIGGQLNDFSARKFVPKSYRKAVKVMARDIEIAVAAADLAFRDANLPTVGTDDLGEPAIDPDRTGCNIGAGLICTELNELGLAVNSAVTDGKFDFHKWGQAGMGNLTPLWLLKYLPNMLSCHATIIHGLKGPSNCITCGDASAHLAIQESALYIRRNTADAVLCGAAESKLNPMGLLRQGKLQRLCTTRNDAPPGAVRPFDADHAGTAIGEGGGLIVLEERDHARHRDARIYAEPVGFGAACDPAAINVLRPTAGNLGRAVSNALRDAGITPDDVDMILTYGTGVPGEDAAEALAWHEALGDRAAEIPAASITGPTGSMFAGSGGVQLAVAAKSLAEQTIPPTAHFNSPAEGCDLNLAAEPRQQDLRYVVTGAYTVGGQSGACVLKKTEHM
jgi:3-oxoacyl-[acyl-carrier-protein] synthase II